VLNALNFKNYSQTINTWSLDGKTVNPNPVVYNKTGDIFGVPRTFKFTLGFKW